MLYKNNAKDQKRYDKSYIDYGLVAAKDLMLWSLLEKSVYCNNTGFTIIVGAAEGLWCVNVIYWKPDKLMSVYCRLPGSILFGEMQICENLCTLNFR